MLIRRNDSVSPIQTGRAKVQFSRSSRTLGCRCVSDLDTIAPNRQLRESANRVCMATFANQSSLTFVWRLNRLWECVSQHRRSFIIAAFPCMDSSFQRPRPLESTVPSRVLEHPITLTSMGRSPLPLIGYPYAIIK